jgi:bifunctional oligoribonuclease and PAP phosphatase NrnA
VRTAKAEIVDLLRGHRRFLICSHVNPDGDAVGSSVGLALYLEQEGKEAYVYNQDGVPQMYRFLPGSDRVRRSLPQGREFDASFLLDCGEPRRVGDAFARFPGQGQRVVVDHHPAIPGLEGLRWIRTEAAATSELLFEIMERYGTPPSPDAATALYVALVTDTGSFRFSNTTPRTLSIASKLLKAGADHRLAMDHIYESFPAARLELLARVLGTLRLSFDGRVASVAVTRRMYDETGAQDDLTDGFVDFPRSIKGVEVAVLFREISAGEHRVNLRSRGNVDVGQLAARFQGGGHPNAAGCTLRGGPAEVQDNLMQVVGEALP